MKKRKDNEKRVETQPPIRGQVEARPMKAINTDVHPNLRSDK